MLHVGYFEVSDEYDNEEQQIQRRWVLKVTISLRPSRVQHRCE